MRRAVFLDRDGVLIRSIIRDGRPYPPASAQEMEILPGAAEALATLRKAGFLLIMVTNQPDVARGTLRLETVDDMNGRLAGELALDGLYVCPHDDRDGCDCRKPAPGMLLRGAREFGLDLATSFMVGDRWRDIEAGRRAGCATVLIDYGYDERIREKPDGRVCNIAEAARWIMGER
jgi:D-glycero-D-manno-heptose 1,7-bisphosphate phosphatase